MAIKAFRVTGWKQYCNDSATEVSRVQLAESAEAAIEVVRRSLAGLLHAEKESYRFILSAKEL